MSVNLDSVPWFHKDYELAREMQVEFLSDDIIDIADDNEGDYVKRSAATVRS
jgi:hypothetical protein